MQRLHRGAQRLARWLALVGGAVLLALIVLVCVSIAGRALNSVLNADLVMAAAPGLAQGLIDAGIGAVPGDFELVEAGMAFCIFAFLPLCQMTAGHASVDVFTDPLPAPAKRALLFAIEALFAAALIVIAWQLALGTERKYDTGETTLFLQFPVWWSYAASLFAAGAAAAAGVVMTLVRGYELATGRAVAPGAPGAAG